MGRYKQPRSFNLVTLLLVLVVGGGGYWAYKFIPIYRMKWEAESILDEAVFRFYRFSHLRGADRHTQEQALRDDVVGRMRKVGVEDPGLAVILEQKDSEVSVSAEYSIEVAHPFVKEPTRLVFRPRSVTTTDRPFE